MTLGEIRKSINSVLYERTASPLYGTFILSWLVCNWKIVYATLFVSEDKLGQMRIEYVENTTTWWTMLFCPLISTAILILLVPFVANGAYWVSLEFKKWKNNKKNSVEGKMLLTVEQSIELRAELINQEQSFDILLRSKNEKIDKLEYQLDEIKRKETKPQSVEKKSSPSQEVFWYNEFSEFEKQENLYKSFNTILKFIKEGTNALEDHISDELYDYYIANEIIARNAKSGYYELTPKGNFFYKRITNRKFGKKD